MDLSSYEVKNKAENALFKNVPIEMLPAVREHFKKIGKKIRVRYRGQRNNPNDRRPWHHRANWCVPEFADRFSIYERKEPTPPSKPQSPPLNVYTFHEAIIVSREIYAYSLAEAKAIAGNKCILATSREY